MLGGTARRVLCERSFLGLFSFSQSLSVEAEAEGRASSGSLFSLILAERVFSRLRGAWHGYVCLGVATIGVS